MRYNIGEVVLFVNLKFIPAKLRMGGLYFPWEDKLEAINIKKLICKEHHRVPGEWDDEIKYDGYIFSEVVDGNEVLFNNQYPRASYGQIDDSSNWTIMDHTTDDFCFYKDASKFLDTIQRGIKELKDSNPDWTEALQKHYDEVAKLIEDQGFSIKIEPIVFKKIGGGEDSYPDITHVVITQKEEVIGVS